MPERKTSSNSPTELLSADYAGFLAELKQRIRQTQLHAAMSVNRTLTMLYWQIGCDILESQNKERWGAKIIDQLSRDLRNEFPDMKGFSTRNLKYMRALAEAYPDSQFVQQVVAQIPWGHNVRILDKLSDAEEREWYIRQTTQYGWSQSVLVHQVETGLYRRQGKALTNFERTLPPPQSDLAHQILKDPYNFDFLSLGSEIHEKDLHKGLVEHVRSFLLELGSGFAFVGSQFHLEVGGQDFYIDLLFYHLRLRCYVVIELKTVDFQPEFAGKINFYLSAVDDLLRHPDDKPSIGIILCKGKNKIVAEYSLRDTGKPIGVSSYQLTDVLPESLKGSLPSIEELELELHDLQEDEDSPKTGT